MGAEDRLGVSIMQLLLPSLRRSPGYRDGNRERDPDRDRGRKRRVAKERMRRIPKIGCRMRDIPVRFRIPPFLSADRDVRSNSPTSNDSSSEPCLWQRRLSPKNEKYYPC